MTALDNVNHRFGRGTLHLASAGTAGKQRHWEMKQARKTPGYTTDWKALVVCTSV
jgi:DNA polymerase V